MYTFCTYMYVIYIYIRTYVYSARMAGLKGLQGMLSKAASSSGLQVMYIHVY